MSHLFLQSSVKTSTNYRELKHQKHEFKRPPLRSIENVYYDSDFQTSNCKPSYGTNISKYANISSKHNESSYNIPPRRYPSYQSNYDKTSNTYHPTINYSSSSNPSYLEKDKKKAVFVLTHPITNYRQSFNSSKAASSNDNVVLSTTSYYSSTKQTPKANVTLIQDNSIEKVDNSDSTFYYNPSTNFSTPDKTSKARTKKPEIYDSILEKYKPDPNFAFNEKRVDEKDISIAALKQLANNHAPYTDDESPETDQSKDLNSSSAFPNQENDFLHENEKEEDSLPPILNTETKSKLNDPVIISTSENKVINLTEKLAKFRNTISIVRKTEEDYGDLLKSDEELAKEKEDINNSKDQEAINLSEPSLIFNDQQNSVDQENLNEEGE